MSPIIRPIRVEDAQERHELYWHLVQEQVGMVPLPEEIDIHVSESHDHITNFLINKKGLWLVCEVNNKIIGEVDIIIPKAKKHSHIGKLTMGVHPDWQNRGLGSTLMKEAMNWAQEQGLVKITLDV